MSRPNSSGRYHTLETPDPAILSTGFENGIPCYLVPRSADDNQIPFADDDDGETPVDQIFN